MVLMYTSFGFGLCAFVAGVVGEHMYCGLLIALNSCSILHHAHLTNSKAYIGGSIIGPIDKTLAHVVTALCLYDSFDLTQSEAIPVWLSIALVVVIYVCKVRNSVEVYKQNVVYISHASMHIVAQCGIMYLLWIKNRYCAHITMCA